MTLTLDAATATCFGKEMFSKAEARMVARRHNSSLRRGRGRKTGKPPVSAYQCGRCGQWHVGREY